MKHQSMFAMRTWLNIDASPLVTLQWLRLVFQQRKISDNVRRAPSRISRTETVNYTEDPSVDDSSIDDTD